MTQRTRTTSRRRLQRQRRRRMLIALAAVLVLALIVTGIILLVNRNKKDVPATTTLELPKVTEEPAAMETPAPTVEPTAVPTPEPVAANAALRPAAKGGLLPIFRKAETTEKMIAITVDDCYQAENLRQIVDKAIECGGKLTIFPIGENVIREKHSQILKYAWENGMELENHTFTHNGLYRCSDEDLAKEIYMQNLALSYILGVDYEAHFLRPKGGDARADHRMHAYARQMEYYGIAHWSQSGSGGSHNSLKQNLKPGEIYLFHTTDKDLELLLEFIPYATQQGYKLVTMNEMFGYEENKTGAPFTKVEDYPVPPLEEFEIVSPVKYKKGSYAYGVKLIQDKLIELGLLDGDADGVYGDGTAKAVKTFQQRNGLPADGICGPETQQKMFGKYV